jgi:hypothetical protein
MLLEIDTFTIGPIGGSPIKAGDDTLFQRRSRATKLKTLFFSWGEGDYIALSTLAGIHNYRTANSISHYYWQVPDRTPPVYGHRQGIFSN